jgi:hypothetical protein
VLSGAVRQRSLARARQTGRPDTTRAVRSARVNPSCALR